MTVPINEVSKNKAPIHEAPMSKVSVDESTVVLGIETSCDETAVAVVMGGTDVPSMLGLVVWCPKLRAAPISKRCRM